MRILLTTTGYPGHVLPLMPFARAARAAGHEVCVAGPPPTAALTEGLEFCAVGRPPHGEVAELLAEAAQRSPEDGHALIVAEGFGRAATRAALPDLLRLVGAWRPDVVLRESQELAGMLAAERHGVPSVRVALGLASTEAETRALVADAVNELRAELGLAGPRDEPFFTLVPQGLDGDAMLPAFRFRELRRPLPVPEAGAPLVYVTLGSVAASRGYFPALYRDLCAAVTELPVRVLVTVGKDADPAALAPLPDNVQVQRWVPQEEALARATAVICHGGYGTLLGALAHGLPLVVLPLFAGDQWHNARRLAEVGVGLSLTEPRRAMFDRPGQQLLSALPAAVERVVTWHRYRRAARGLADEIAALPPVSAAPRVLTDHVLEMACR